MQCRETRLVLAVWFGVSVVVASLSPDASARAATPATIAAASPSPCPSATPGVALQSDVTPSGSPEPCLRTIVTVSKVGRKANLIGIANAASEGTISQEEIANRPVLRPGEVLEAIPGLVISQHSGEGKANQYYLRGFQLDHGTDLESTIDGIPINMPSHAHGQGYSDINWLMPELVSYVEFKKGTYYADQGDFSTAGSYNLFFRDTIPTVTSFGIGDYGYDRFFAAGSPGIGGGAHLLYGLEIYHDNGTFVKPDEYHKVNAILRYSLERGRNSLVLTGSAYDGPFDSTDQIPERLVDAGELNRYGYIDPTDGGNTYRYAFSGQYRHRSANGDTKIALYGEEYFLDLFSNFTYYEFDANDYYNTVSNPITCKAVYTTCVPNTGGPNSPRAPDYVTYCPANQFAVDPNGPARSVAPGAFTFSCPDQREQRDKRFIAGGSFKRTFITPGTRSEFGFGVRNDNISTLGLYLTDARNRYPDGTLSDDRVVERDSFAYLQSDLRAGKFRVQPGLRGDLYAFHVNAFDPANSGKRIDAQLNPKVALAYAFTPNFEAYADYGESFHSNDARSVLGVHDPQTHADFDPSGIPVTSNTALDRATGEEVGFRVHQKEITTTVSGWQLLLANELVFDGDHGDVDIAGPTYRKGIEVANYYTPADWLTIDADFATSTARFLTNPGNAGTQVPESLAGVVALGATVDEPNYAASLRMRYFGPRNLDQSGIAKSPPSTTFNGQFTLKMAKRSRFSVDVFNIFNVDVPDVTYYYASWLPQDAANPAYARNATINPALGGSGVNDYHFHPSERRIIRATLSTAL
ncbi:MAG: TonB-dependent receptor [Candidatus Eremiobacteraeota bacterium]|nr:TonB-dependent receptor [Candidatus Eremiobacteraeota bacterium]